MQRGHRLYILTGSAKGIDYGSGFDLLYIYYHRGERLEDISTISVI